MSIKLSDTQLAMLSAAARRDDHSLTLPENLKGGAAHKVGMKLIAVGLVREVRAKAGMPVWRRDAQNAQSYALKLTAAGAKAIAVTPDDDATPAADEERLPAEQSPTLAPQNQTDAGAFASPSAQAFPTPRPPRVGTKLAQAIEMLRTTEGATIVELSEAMGWLPHSTRAVLTGLRKRGYAPRLDRSDAGRSSAYRITVDANEAHAGTAPAVIESSSAALIDGASDSSVSPMRPASAMARRRSGSSRTSRAA
jgi:DNA-binding MarR family transcriptional regulator